MSFKIPWVSPYDVTYIGNGRWRVGCVYVRGRFVDNLVVQLL